MCENLIKQMMAITGYIEMEARLIDCFALFFLIIYIARIDGVCLVRLNKHARVSFYLFLMGQNAILYFLL